MVCATTVPNLQELQLEIIDLLEEVGKLMANTKMILDTDDSGNKYEESEQEIHRAIKNVENLELTMSIVAPMKAGKSTIVNTIIGQELLPSRNTAMTTLPTKIVFNPELNEPILTIVPETLTIFQQTHQALENKFKTVNSEYLNSKIAQYPHLVQLLLDIQQTSKSSLSLKTNGRKEIVQVLSYLNDIIRLCSVLEPSLDPLTKVSEAPCIETPFWRSQSTDRSSKFGNLVIVDTPGPNEAGENLKLTATVENQLRKSSIVLIVLDFTQLNNQAAAEIKKQVQPILQLLGKENLYVLINKVDRRRDGDMTPEQVRNFVFADLELSPSKDAERIFEISAIQAFSATKFLLELQHKTNANIADLETAKALAQEALGARWQEKLQTVTRENLQEEAEYLWDNSGFKPFLDQAIQALIKNAAPRCLKSALKLVHHQLLALKDDLNLRQSAIYQDEEKLIAEIDALEADLKHLELCHDRLRKVDTIRSNLQNNLHTILEVLKKEANVSLEDYFLEEDKERGDLLKKADIAAREIFLTNIGNFEIFPKWVSQKLKSTVEYKTTGITEFKNQQEAEEFATQAVSWAKERAEVLLSSVRQKTDREIEKSRSELTHFLEKETKPILERSRTRLNESFDVKLALTPPSLSSRDDAILEASIVKRKTRYISQGYGTKTVQKRAWHHWLWLIPLEEQISFKKPDRKESFYLVSLEELIKQINNSIEASVNKINQEIDRYFEEDFRQRIDVYFEGLDGYLRNYRDSLKVAEKDRQLSLEQQEKLKSSLTQIISAANSNLEIVNSYFDRLESSIEP